MLYVYLCDVIFYFLYLSTEFSFIMNKHVVVVFLSGRESLKDLEKLQMEAASLRSANEDQQRHIEILEQALNNAQSKVVRLEEEVSLHHRLSTCMSDTECIALET